jgi:hypothetical protein
MKIFRVVRLDLLIREKQWGVTRGLVRFKIKNYFDIEENEK